MRRAWCVCVSVSVCVFVRLSAGEGGKVSAGEAGKVGKHLQSFLSEVRQMPSSLATAFSGR